MNTSLMQKRVSQLLCTHLGQYTIRENYRPGWMNGLELDFYVEELHLAFEVQGAQHYRFIPYFHVNEQGFEEQLKRDRRKKEICSFVNVRLCEVTSEEDVIQALESVLNIHIPYSPHPNAVDWMGENNELRRARELRESKRGKYCRNQLRSIRRERAREHPRPDKIRKHQLKLVRKLLEIYK